MDPGEPARSSGRPDDRDLIDAIVEHAVHAPAGGRSAPAELAGASVSYLPVAARRPGPAEPETDEARRSDVDEWGRSEHMRAIVRRLYDPMYRYWFRVEWEGLEKIPTEGGALLIANHAGAIPADAPAIMHGIETELGRPVYGLADYFFRTLPGVGTMWSRTGGVPAHPDNAYRLLHDQGQLALVFPEGTKATSKTYSDRYRLRRFGRGGFVEIAMRAGVPIIPIAVVGAEEAQPVFARLNLLRRLTRLPYVPVTPPLPLPAKFRIRFLEPVWTAEFGDAPWEDQGLVQALSHDIRALIQENLFEMVAARRSVWLG